jgi:hypothetical protein
MKKLLLVISQQRESKKSVEYSLSKAIKDNLSIEIIYIIDEKMTGNLEACLSEMGFVGEKPGDDLVKELNQEYIKRGEEKITEISKLAEEKKIPLKGEVLKGNYQEEVLKKAVMKEVEMIVINQKSKSIFHKIFFSETKHIIKKINKPIEVFESEL